MNAPFQLRRAGGLALAACIALSISRAAYTPPPPDKHDQPPLPPALEKRVEDYFVKARADKQQAWEKRMQKEIADIVSATNLSADGQKALEEPAGQAIAVSLDPWVAKTDWGLRKLLAQMPSNQANFILNQRAEMLANIVGDWSTNVLAPFEQDIWIKALREVLTPAQMTAWEKAQADKRDAIEKDSADALKASGDRTRDARMMIMTAECQNIESAAGLDHDRSAKLEALAKTVVDQTMDKWHQRLLHLLYVADPDTRRQIIAERNIWIAPEDDESPTKLPAWTDGVAHLLTADEQARLAAADAARRERRVNACALVMIALLDEKIAFTMDQRQKLLPLAERLVQDSADIIPAGAYSPYYAVSPGVYYQAAAKATDAELKPMLDDLQLGHWRKLPNWTDDQMHANEEAKAAAPDTAPVDVDTAISDFLYTKSEKERAQSLEDFVTKAEDAVRAARLGPADAAQLQIAARGAHEEYLANWDWFTEQQVRAQLQDATPQNVRQRLNNIQDFIFQRNYRGFGNSVDQNWENTVRAELNEQQRALWQKEIDARADFRCKAIAGYVMVEFDRKFELSAAQFDKLSPIVARVLHDNFDGIGATFGGFGDTPWFLQGFYSMVPIMGVSDKDLKSVLSDDQVKRWTSSQEYGNASQFWNSIQQMQNRRVQGNNMRN